MRVIAGQYKSRKLDTPKGDWLRPTSDRTREFIFSYLGSSVLGAEVLDLYAGVGSLGIESLSRGASGAIFVDADRVSVQYIRKNCATLQIEPIILHMDSRLFLKKTAGRYGPYDLIFADPPYRYQEFDTILSLIWELGLLRHQGMVIYEASSKSPRIEAGNFRIVKEKLLGDTRITFYEMLDEQR